jgi:hypothetical protein
MWRGSHPIPSLRYREPAPFEDGHVVTLQEASLGNVIEIAQGAPKDWAMSSKREYTPVVVEVFGDPRVEVLLVL